MLNIFLKLLNMSIAASWLVLAVLAVRLLFPKMPKWIRCLLWGVVALRLVMPFAVTSPISLIPSAEVIPQSITVSQTPAIYSGIPAVNNAINPLFTLHEVPPQQLGSVLSALSLIWLAGVAILLLAGLFTYLRLCRQVRASIRLNEDRYLCDDVQSPFVLGIFRPKIYLPSGLSEDALQYVLAHEAAHIHRRDHWWKPLGFLLLTIYWFNPLLWLAYILLCRDIEKACDEKVIAGMDNAGKKGYSEALIACSMHRRMVMICPVAFGEVSVKSRIKGVLNYKKPAFWIMLASAVVCVAMAVCFLTNPLPCFHRYDSQITMAATCDQKGMLTRTCDLCGHSYTRAVERIAHTYDEGLVTVQPTCTHTGVVAYTCTGCGVQKTQTLEKTAHVAGGPIIVQAANCIQTGQKTATCTYCRKSFVTEILPVNTEHDLSEQVLREPTCAQEGEGLRACSRCDYQESCSYEKLEHQYKSRIISEPNCTDEGIKRTWCTVCNQGFDSFLPPKIKHEWVKVNSFNGNYYYCKWCYARKSDPEPPWDPRTGYQPARPDPTPTLPVVRIWP